jgi:hypothetical protein
VLSGQKVDRAVQCCQNDSRERLGTHVGKVVLSGAQYTPNPADLPSKGAPPLRPEEENNTPEEAKVDSGG